MKTSVTFTVLVSGCALLFLSGCTAVGIATGIGATAGVAAVQEGGVSRAAKDAVIQAKINDLWFRNDLEMFTKLDMTVNNGRVLLTGVVQNPEHRVEAVRLAWQPEGVTQVINEITVADSSGVTGFARDAWITSRLRTALIFDKDVLSVNYSIDTVRRVVYLMGFAQSQAELNRVMEISRTLRDVDQVVSYVKLVGEINDPVAAKTITSQQYARPPQTHNADAERLNWGERRDEAVEQSTPNGEPVILVPGPAGYPNVDGREPILIDSGIETRSTTADVIQSEELLWEERR
ncbi:MAG: BON domain-containing protein [Bdellovibrionales bacterium]